MNKPSSPIIKLRTETPSDSTLKRCDSRGLQQRSRLPASSNPKFSREIHRETLAVNKPYQNDWIVYISRIVGFWLLIDILKFAVSYASSLDKGLKWPAGAIEFVCPMLPVFAWWILHVYPQDKQFCKQELQYLVPGSWIPIPGENRKRRSKSYMRTRKICVSNIFTCTVESCTHITI